jgi:hypothetical protein
MDSALIKTQTSKNFVSRQIMRPECALLLLRAQASVVLRNSWHIKPCLFPPGGVAPRCLSPCYVASSRLARRKKSIGFISAGNYEALH